MFLLIFDVNTDCSCDPSWRKALSVFLQWMKRLQCTKGRSVTLLNNFYFRIKYLVFFCSKNFWMLCVSFVWRLLHFNTKGFFNTMVVVQMRMFETPLWKMPFLKGISLRLSLLKNPWRISIPFGRRGRIQLLNVLKILIDILNSIEEYIRAIGPFLMLWKQ